MSDLYDILEDTRAWMFFDDEGEGNIQVYCRCPKCGRYIKRGKCFGNRMGEIKLKGFICKIHGEIEPFWMRD